MSFLSTIALYLKVYPIRFVASIASFLDRYFCPPTPSKQAFTVSIPTTLRKQPAQINLLFYTPQRYNRRRKYPLVINFHGGGYTIGRAADDARWAAYVTDQLKAVFVSVEYGLAPEHPYPTAIGDGVDAIRWLGATRPTMDLTASTPSPRALAPAVPCLWRYHYDCTPR